MACFTKTQLEEIAKKHNIKLVDAQDHTIRFLYKDSYFSESGWVFYYHEGHYKSFINFSRIDKDCNWLRPISYNTMRYQINEEKEFEFRPETVADIESKIKELILDYKNYKFSYKLNQIKEDFV